MSATLELPVALTRFVGRVQELADLTRLLGQNRLLTLTGPGGSGKTRLARELAGRAEGQFDSIVWVDLAPVVEPSQIPQQIAQALGLVERPDQSTLESVRQFIGTQAVLLVLDNCEHLVDAAAGLVEGLLLRSGRLVVVATSREALGVQGETAWLVPPLAAAEAVQLFVERAQSTLPSFVLDPATTPAVHDICRRLDGIPLAIELAAARVRILSVDQIAARLSDALRLLSTGSRTALPRHRTLRGTLDWSFELLTDFEQLLLTRLAVFAGTFSLLAAEAVCAGGSVDADQVLDGVAALVDKSLVILETVDHEARYRLLETVRQYGVERLQASGEWEPLRARHADFFLAALDMAAPHLFCGAADPVWMSRLTVNSANLRAVAEWAAERDDRVESALRFGWAINWFWFARGQFEESRHQLTDALAKAATADPLLVAKASVALGHIGIWQGRRSGIRQLMERAVEIFRQGTDPILLAYGLNGVGAALVFEGDPVGAAAFIDEAFEHASQLGPHVLRSFILFWRGWAAKMRGEVPLARASFEEATRIGRAIGHPPAIAHPLSLLGQLEVAEGRPRQALACFAESLAVHARIGDHWGIARGLEGIGAAVGELGLPVESARLLAAAAALRLRNATPLSATEVDEFGRALDRCRQALGESFEATWDAGRRLELDNVVAIALALATGGADRAESRTQPARSSGSAEILERREPALRVRSLGGFQVFRHGAAIGAAAWGSARPRELLAFILAQPQGTTREQAGLALWPEASAAQVRNSFHVTLHRLRKALGDGEWIAAAQERYQLAATIDVDFDAQTFEREVAQALRSGPLDHQGADRLGQALDLYRGDFLAGEPVGPWHTEIRDRLARLFVDGNLALSAWLLEHDASARAIDVCRRIIAQDPLHEETWRRLMVAQTRLGDRNQAIRSYHQLAELLKAEIDAVPDRVTVKLFEQVKAGDPVAWTRS